MSFANIEIQGTILHLQFKTTDRNKKLVAVYVGGFIDLSKPESVVEKLCEDVKANLYSAASLETKRELFTCTVWGEVEESCSLQLGKPYSFKGIRKAHNYEGTANFDCLIQNITLINN